MAGQSFGIDVPYGQEQSIRNVETQLNKTWGKWCNDFNFRKPQEVLAMVAFQYARYYYNLIDSLNEHEKAITDFEKSLDEMLKNIAD